MKILKKKFDVARKTSAKKSNRNRKVDGYIHDSIAISESIFFAIEIGIEFVVVGFVVVV